MSESITRGGDLVLVGKAPFVSKEVETLFLWVRLLLFFKGGDLVLVGKAPFILFQRGGDLVHVGKAPFIFQKRWRPCSCG